MVVSVRGRLMSCTACVVVLLQLWLWQLQGQSVLPVPRQGIVCPCVGSIVSMPAAIKSKGMWVVWPGLGGASAWMAQSASCCCWGVRGKAHGRYAWLLLGPRPYALYSLGSCCCAGPAAWHLQLLLLLLGAAMLNAQPELPRTASAWGLLKCMAATRST